MNSLGLIVGAVLGLALTGCGSKSNLEIEPAELALPDGEVPECRSDLDCEDGFGCTLDDCEAGRCVQRIDREACETGSVCSVGRCDARRGCVVDPVDCDDGVACTVDRCADPEGCDHTPDDTLCPISHRCEPDRGCVAQAIIHDNGALYSVDLPSGELARITAVAARLTDIALTNDRRLYGVDLNTVFRVDGVLGGVGPIAPTPARLVALEEGPSGLLYAAGQDDQVFAIDRESGDARLVATLPPPWVAAGDIAFVEGRMLVTVTDEASSESAINQLAEVDLEAGTGTILGPTGFSCIWGVAAFGELLYGFTCHGQLIRIDPFSGEAELIRSLGLRIGGAAAR